MGDQGSAGRGRHVLVLNDTAEILDLFRDLLEDEGYRVTVGAMAAGGLAEAVADVQRLMPDLLVLDFLFGNEPLGWQLLQLLRMDRATARLPVIVCTAAVGRIEEVSAHLARMRVGVVLKPFDVEALLGEIERTLKRAEGNHAAGRRARAGKAAPNGKA